MATAFYTHPDFKFHDNGMGHPERPARLTAIENALKNSGWWDKLAHPSFEAASESDLERCHTRSHIERIKEMAASGGGRLDGDTTVGPHSYAVACLASGAAMSAVRAVIEGESANAFVAVRPPGHHAESGSNPRSPWGFCLFDHIAVAARYAQSELGIGKIAILDFDVHHGNGTQEIFYHDKTVFFASLHQMPLFPGSGTYNERGEGGGVGTTLNIPLSPESDIEIYREAWTKVGEEVRDFHPELILLSAGYDAHIDDPLASMALQSEDYAELVSAAKSWATELCGGNLVAVLEGGYDLPALGESVVATIEVLASDMETKA